VSNYTIGDVTINGTQWGQITYNQTFSDVVGSVIIGMDRGNWGSSEIVGVVLRGLNQSHNNVNSYYLGVVGNGLSLYWGVGSTNIQANTPLATAALPDGYSLKRMDQGNNQYRLEFSFIGR